MNIFRHTAMVFVCLGAGACAYSPSLVDRALSFNKSIADATNQEILLNALRARDRMPTYYTRVASDTANTTFSPTVSMQIPLGPGAADKGYFPNVSVGSSFQNQLSLQNLDDQKFMRGVLTPVPVDVLGYYLHQGWPAEVLLTVTIAEISVTPDTARTLENAFDAQCAERPRTDYCNDVLPSGVTPPASGQYVTQQLGACLANPDDYVRGAGDVMVLENYPENAEQMRCFQWMLRVLISLEPTTGKSATYEVIARDVPLGNLKSVTTFADMEKADLVMAPGEGDKVTLCKRTSVTGLRLLRLNETAPVAAADPPGDAPKPDAGEPQDSGGAIPLVATRSATPASGCGAAGHGTGAKLDLTTRSLDGMIYFLGEILRADESAGGGTIWSWNSSENREGEWKLFIAERGSMLSEGAVTVSFNGDTYYVPSTCENPHDCAEGGERHRSLQVLALLGQIWGLQKEEAQMPIVPTVTVVSP